MKTAKEKLLVSFSGGRTSAFMAQWLLKNMQHKYEMIFVFANTGKEREETLVFADRCDKHFGLNLVWVEAVPQEGRVGTTHKIVSFETASRNGEPFEAVIAKYGIPNKPMPHCTRELKERPIKSYARSIDWNTCKMAIGIRIDEIDRKNHKAGEMGIVYPLISMIPSTKLDVNEFWASMPFDLEIKSYEGNCDLCWKKSLRKLLTLAKENPHLLTWWEEMERKYETYVPESRAHNEKIKLPIRFFRSGMSVDQLRKLAAQPFDPARHESKDINRQMGFDFSMDSLNTMLTDYELDATNGCEESCEVFSDQNEVRA